MRLMSPRHGGYFALLFMMFIIAMLLRCRHIFAMSLLRTEHTSPTIAHDHARYRLPCCRLPCHAADFSYALMADAAISARPLFR